MIRCDEQVLHGSKCIFMCFGAKKLEGVSALTCNDGSFDGDIPSCIEQVCDTCCSFEVRDIPGTGYQLKLSKPFF